MRHAYLAALLPAGCAAGNSLPSGYGGPTATVQGSGHYEDAHRAALFYVEEFNSKPINESFHETRARNRGFGREMNLWMVQREVPAQDQGAGRHADHRQIGLCAFARQMMLPV